MKGNWWSLANNTTKQNANVSQLLSYDKTMTPLLNLAVFFKKHHSRNHKRDFSKIECVEYV